MTGSAKGKPPQYFVGLGFELVVPIVIGAFGGRWLDERLGTTPWLVVVGSLLGIGAGFLNFFREVIPGFLSRKGNGEDE
jgi:F0F1-type ATP synthase assembly protein I